MRPMHFGLRRASGFTLIEIMLVMAILGVLTGTVIINLHAGFQDLALENDTLYLAEVIQAAQLHARTSRCICRLDIEPDRGEYRVTQAATEDRTFQPVDNIGATHVLERGVYFYEVRKLKPGSASAEQICFFPDATAEPAQIVLASVSGERRIVETQALAGPPTVTRE